MYHAGPGWIFIGCFERRKNSLCFRIHCKLSWTQTGWFVEEVRGGGGGGGGGEGEGGGGGGGEGEGGRGRR